MEPNNYPYYPPHYTEDNSNTTNNEVMNEQQPQKRNSLLLVTEPQDLDKLFKTNRSSRQVEQDICFPSNGRPSTSSTTLDQESEERLELKSHHRMTLRHNSSSSLDMINLSALSLFNEIVSPTQSPIPRHYYTTTTSNGEEKKKLLSLYGDNNNSSSNNNSIEKPYSNIVQPQEDRFTYYHIDTGCIKGRSLNELKLPPHTTLEELLLKENYWIDVTLPSNEEMKAISKVK